MVTLTSKTQATVNTLKNDPTLSTAQKQQKFQTIQQGFTQKLEAILTPSQRATIAATRKVLLGKVQQVQTLNKNLLGSLSATQKQNIKAVVQAQNAQGNQIATSTTLSDDQKRSQIQALVAGNNTKIMAILTPQQNAMFAQISQLKREIQLGALSLEIIPH